MDLQSVFAVVQSWPPEDRLQLVDEVLEGLEASPSPFILTELHKEELQRRLDANRDHPKAGSPWAEVKARLQGEKH